MKNWLIAWAVRGALAAADRTPPAVLSWLGRAIGRGVRALSPRALRLARAHAARCLPPEEAERAAHACFERAGENLATSLLLRRPSVRARDHVEVTDDAEQALRGALSEGRGAVFVSAHVGPFELLVAAVAELGIRPAIVVRESYDSRLDAWIDAHRVARGIDVIHRGRPGAAARIVRALRRGQPVGFLPDLGGRVPKLPVEFLGAATGFPFGPQQIAQRLSAPIVVGTLRRATRSRRASKDSRPFTLTIERLATNGSLATLTQRVAGALELRIRDAADDFPWMAPELAPEPSRAAPADTSRAEEKALGLSTTCRSKGGRTWGSEASRA